MNGKATESWKVRLFLENIYERKIQQEYDLMMPIVADEGDGKSTLMLQIAWVWNDIVGRESSIDAVLDQLVWDQNGFKQALVNYPAQSVIPVQDAARVLYKKDAMDPDQKELEKDLLDSRTKEFLVLWGFQGWDIIPSMLQDRRAKCLLRIPDRGIIHGYNRESMNDIEEDDWPEPDMRATFPSLDGTELWQAFKDLDKQKKEERMAVEDDDSQEVLGVKEVAEDIKDNGIGAFLSRDRRNDELYVDDDVIQIEYDHLSVRQARQVRKLLERDERVKQRIDGGATADA